MPSTTNMNLEQAPTGVVEWVPLWNVNVDIMEVGRTVSRTAGENLTEYLGFYIKAADGKAWLADATTGIDGIWQSASTLTGATGLGQYSGTMINTDTPWTFTVGDIIYVTTSGALTATPTATIVGRALSATEVKIEPGGALGGFTRAAVDETIAGAWQFDDVVNCAAGLNTIQAVTDVHDTTPTDAELDTAFGTPATVGRAFIGTVDDADGDTNFYICASSDASWYYLKMTKAV